MTEEKRQPREQIANHIYRRPAVREIRATVSSVSGVSARQRVVTKHHEVQPSAGESYVQRRNRLYSAREKAPTHPESVVRKPRTLAQTGAPAVNGQMRVLKRPLPYHHTPVPARSGRRQARRSGLLWRMLSIFIPLLLLVLGANFALTSSAFRVAQVSVMGAHNDMLVQSIQHMGMQGQNIFLIDVVALTARIEMLPMVASASLEKQWPNQLQVAVTERTPVLLWRTAHGTYSVDRLGVVIASVDQTAGAETLMTVVDGRRGNTSGGKGTGVRDVRPGVKLNASDIAFAAAVFAELPKVVGITDFILRYSDTMPGGLAKEPGTIGGKGVYIIESKAGWIAYLGGANDANPLHNRLIELQQILALAQREQLNLATIDLRFDLRPVYTLKQA